MKKITACLLIILLSLGIMLLPAMYAKAAPTPAPTPAGSNVNQGKSVEEQLYDYYTALAAQELAKGNKKAAEEAKKKAEEYAAIVNAQKSGTYTPGTMATPRKSVMDVATTYYDSGNGWSLSADGMTYRHNKTGEIYYSYKGLTTDYPEFGKFVYTGDTCKVMVAGCCERLQRYSILTYERACEKMKAEGYSLLSADKRALIQWVDPNVTKVKFTHNAMVCVFERDYSLTPSATPSEYYYDQNTGATPTPTPTPYDYDPNDTRYGATPTPTLTPTPTATATPSGETPTATPYTVQDAEKYRVN
ncbi:MAG: hypothetical protein K5888_08620 [Lachnospiraceae bacterium]|nr:hypothetical protein [Lachnospiraceae bacterium]